MIKTNKSVEFNCQKINKEESSLFVKFMWFYLEEKEIIVETCHSFTDHKLSQFKNINDTQHYFFLRSI